MKNRWQTYVILTLVIWGIWAFLSKLTADTIDPLFGLVLEILGTLIVAVLLLISMKFKIEKNLKGAIYGILTGLFSMGALLMFLYALKLGQSVIVIPLTALYPAVTVLLSFFFLEEKLNNRQIIGICLAILASVLLGM